jgi:hypothetical protein
MNSEINSDLTSEDSVGTDSSFELNEDEVVGNNINLNSDNNNTLEELKYKHDKYVQYTKRIYQKSKELEQDKSTSMWCSLYYTFFNNFNKKSTITLNELVTEVGVNASRYFFASKSLDGQMDFDMDLAIANSNNNPVYYIEYANARICKILRGKEIDTDRDFRTINSDIAYTILNKLLDFNDVVISAGTKKEPHLIANYVYELAALFHSYYAKERIITDNELATSERINLLRAIQIVIENALDLIGIIPREEM